MAHPKIRNGAPENYDKVRAQKFLQRIVDARTELYPNYEADDAEQAELTNLLMISSVRGVFDFAVYHASSGNKEPAALLEELLLAMLHSTTEQVAAQYFEIMRELGID